MLAEVFCRFGMKETQHQVAIAVGDVHPGVEAAAAIAREAYDAGLAVAGMSFSFEPNAVVGGRAVNLGGTVVIGEDGPIELNPLTAQLLRVRTAD